MPGLSHRSSSNDRCDVGYCADRQPRSDGPIGLSFSKILNNSANLPNRRSNLYSLNSAKSTTIIRPVTFKQLLRPITVPEEQSEFEQEASLIVDWYNEHRPHETLGGKTPNEVYFSRSAANEQPRLEPRTRWPRSSPCARPQVDIDGQPGAPIILEIDCLAHRTYLPIIRARHAA